MQFSSRDAETEDVLLPHDSIGKKLKGLRRATLSIPNRLRSIVEDAHFVEEVAEAYRLPLIANERCGSWYVPPSRRAGTAYFKSTDGHTNQWAISLRRLNLQVLDVAAEHRGCIIVDSTRRGKSMPDALSKTVPIWCAVFNRLLFPEDVVSRGVYTPPRCVSSIEQRQIEERLDDFVRQLATLELDLTALRAKLCKPVRPLWVIRDSQLPTEPLSYDDFLPIVLCTASRHVTEGDVAADGYVQGAGDDNEGWSSGLTADVFWHNKVALIEAPEQKLPDLIESLMEQEHISRIADKSAVLIEPTTWLFVGSDNALLSSVIKDGLVLHCSLAPNNALQTMIKDRYVHLKCRDGKQGSRDLRQSLQRLRELPFATEQVPVLACCKSGSDLAIGVALAIMCMHDVRGTMSMIDKKFIRQRLGWISMSLPHARPLRSTLQSVNDFLMSGKLDPA